MIRQILFRLPLAIEMKKKKKKKKRIALIQLNKCNKAIIISMPHS
jgi:hypothetical protein